MLITLFNKNFHLTGKTDQKVIDHIVSIISYDMTGSDALFFQFS